jgi:hypothetical protein
MNKIIIHWTAGANEPNSTDFQHYHFLINGNGLTIEGKYKPLDNMNCKDGVYAAHTGGGNTGAIGVAYCGMYGYVSGKPDSTKYPLTKKQCEAGFKKVAELCKQYGITISPETVMTHYEFGKKNPHTTSAGKIDITYMHPYPEILPADVGNFIRTKVKWYYKLL